MNLKDIKEESCPVCGCRKVEMERSDHQHCNGHWNEYRYFACGLHLYFCPNFMRVEVTQRCSKDPEQIEFLQKQEKAKRKLIDCIARLDVDEGWKNSKLMYLT